MIVASIAPGKSILHANHSVPRRGTYQLTGPAPRRSHLTRQAPDPFAQRRSLRASTPSRSARCLPPTT
jgi:hypothetical protein